MFPSKSLLNGPYRTFIWYEYFKKPIQNWKAMAKDRTNYYQLTPAQIRTKMKHFRRDTVSWNCYMKDRKERGLEEIELEI